MKYLILSILWLGAVSLFSAPPTLTFPVGTNEMIITADDGFTYNGTNAVYRRNVHVVDPQMELLCELLTIFIETNNNQVNLILAETNVVIIEQDAWAIGDRAVYTLTNDIIELSGNVLMQHPRLWGLGTNAIYDHKNNNMFMPGKVIMGVPKNTKTNALAFPQMRMNPPKARP